MNNQKTKFRILRIQNSLWRYGLWTIVFFLLSFLLSQYFSGSFGNTFEKHKLQGQINDIVESMDELQNEISTLPEDFNYFNSLFLKKTHDKNLQIFVYQHDSLVAWSDNDYSLSSSTSREGLYVEKTQNAYVLVKNFKTKFYSYCLTFPLFSNYSIENEYLINELNPVLGLRKHVKISLSEKTDIPFYSANNSYLFSATWDKVNPLNSIEYGVLFCFYILGYLFSILFIIQLIKKVIHKPFWVFILISLSTILVYILFHWLQWPDIIYDSEIFSPDSFAASYLFNSLGSLLVSSIIGLFVFIAFLEYITTVSLNIKKPFVLQILYFGFLLLLFLLLLLLKETVSDLIFNATISFDISQISTISYLSIIGLTALGIWIYGFFILWIKGHSLFQNHINKSFNEWWPILGILLVCIIWIWQFENSDWPSFVFFIFLIALKFSLSKWSKIRTTSLITFYLLGFSILLSFWFNANNIENEHNKRKSLIQRISLSQDPQAEYLFTEISKKIYQDEYLLNQFETGDIDFDSIANYIKEQYFRKNQHFDQYDFQITTCTQDLKLVIMPQNLEIICDSFFYQNLIQYGALTSDKNLYLLEYGTGQTNYLGLLRFYQSIPEGIIPYTIYLEINSKLKRKGFTRLLSQKEYNPFEKIVNYSLATYEHDRRVEVYGTFGYPEYFSWPTNDQLDLEFYEKDEFDHLIYRQTKDKVFVLSLKLPPRLSKLAPFSYLFIFLGLLFVLLGYIGNDPALRPSLQLSFGNRLQLVMIPIILVSFAVISSITIFYIQKLNEDKNHDQLERLAISLQTEFEHKLSAENDLSMVNVDYLNSLLVKFAKVFDTDINIYHINGQLLATTRQEIFDYSLLSNQLNPHAFNYLRKEHQSLYIAKENIGGLVYSSAYVPFHNKNGESIAFLNLPYFAHEEVLQTEISSLLLALMNVYTLVIVLSVLVILLVSNYVSRPISMLKERLQAVGMGKANQKIEWHGIEEFDALVEEYNKMIDALAISSGKLAKSERETAWREMAKQVAHEIKNPLTPMKLSVQYMMRTYDAHDPNQKDKIFSLSNTLIEQIDTLANIASAFSDFATMPKSINELQEVNSIIRSAMELFKEEDKINIQLNSNQEYWAFIDKKQWLRVFNNLIKNSIQAVEGENEVTIIIDMQSVDNKLYIKFSDNGKGIPEEMKDLIFVPNFTTKSKGAGLGLAMVKSIINNSEGSIRFESKANMGTTFFIELPLQNSLR